MEDFYARVAQAKDAILSAKGSAVDKLNKTRLANAVTPLEDGTYGIITPSGHELDYSNEREAVSELARYTGEAQANAIDAPEPMSLGSIFNTAVHSIVNPLTATTRGLVSGSTTMGSAVSKYNEDLSNDPTGLLKYVTAPKETSMISQRDINNYHQAKANPSEESTAFLNSPTGQQLKKLQGEVNFNKIYDKHIQEVAQSIKDKFPVDRTDEAVKEARFNYDVNKNALKALANLVVESGDSTVKQGVESLPYSIMLTTGGAVVQIGAIYAMAKGKEQELTDTFVTTNNREPTVEEAKRIQIGGLVSTVLEKVGDHAAIALANKLLPKAYANKFIDIAKGLTQEGISGGATEAVDQAAVYGKINSFADIGKSAIEEAGGTIGMSPTLAAGEIAKQTIESTVANVPNAINKIKDIGSTLATKVEEAKNNVANPVENGIAEATAETRPFEEHPESVEDFLSKIDAKASAKGFTKRSLTPSASAKFDQWADNALGTEIKDQTDYLEVMAMAYNYSKLVKLTDEQEAVFQKVKTKLNEADDRIANAEPIKPLSSIEDIADGEEVPDDTELQNLALNQRIAEKKAIEANKVFTKSLSSVAKDVESGEDSGFTGFRTYYKQLKEAVDSTSSPSVKKQLVNAIQSNADNFRDNRVEKSTAVQQAMGNAEKSRTFWVVEGNVNAETGKVAYATKDTLIPFSNEQTVVGLKNAKAMYLKQHKIDPASERASYNTIIHPQMSVSLARKLEAEVELGNTSTAFMRAYTSNPRQKLNIKPEVAKSIISRSLLRDKEVPKNEAVDNTSNIVEAIKELPPMVGGPKEAVQEEGAEPPVKPTKPIESTKSVESIESVESVKPVESTEKQKLDKFTNEYILKSIKESGNSDTAYKQLEADLQQLKDMLECLKG